MRIAHWIIHNEVDGGSHWTNMGDKPIATFMDTYLPVSYTHLVIAENDPCGDSPECR